eukprot:NODE_4058_length_869_cov_41.434146_g3744_i0.p1 GENE.NODE_4058_length_869_cov_41.434146_g3744_i0~~NODE_4058_length_869_cov_41.434146_g3744_i0.p1  ORF type:complete len:232 (+),score=34.64 NODE_4058_length_869_cov_41.434146_g3744_i0:95-790(+)
MMRRLILLNKFKDHIYRDATGTPWFHLDTWKNYREPDFTPQPPLSQSARLVRLTFIDPNGTATPIQVEPGTNLGEAASLAGINMFWGNVDTDAPESAWSHMVVSSPHFERLLQPDFSEDKRLADLEVHGVSHRNSRIIKFLYAGPELDGAVLVHPWYADVVSHNYADPFTGTLADKDEAISPTFHVEKVLEAVPDYKFPGVWECLRNGIDSYPDLWDYTRQQWLKRAASKQ